MKYTQKSFTVPASAGSKAECDRVGHTEPDRHGKCLRCGEKVEVPRSGVSGRDLLREVRERQTDSDTAASRRLAAVASDIRRAVQPLGDDVTPNEVALARGWMDAAAGGSC